jgi:hypothetical protein
VSQQLVFHYRDGGDYAANGIEPARISEIDTRYAAAMFARLGELADLPLGRPLTGARLAVRLAVPPRGAGDGVDRGRAAVHPDQGG